MMKNTSPDEFTPDKDIFADSKLKPRRRNHKPKANLATWLFIAWLAFMTAWGCKHLYHYWMGIPEPTENSTISAPDESGVSSER